jgi:cellulose 1,4-beta-cellobiosidase
MESGSSDEANTGYGLHGSCCPEVDIFQANSRSTALSAKTCEFTNQQMCDGDACGGLDSGDANRDKGPCDPDGCTFNPYQSGATSFYGPDKILNTKLPFTVVTQFITEDGTAEGDLIEIKRFYKQGGKRIENPMSQVERMEGNSISESFCWSQNNVFGTKGFQKHWGIGSLSKSLRAGMVMSIGIWDDKYTNGQWLDGKWPSNGTQEQDGVMRGDCEVETLSQLQQSHGRLGVRFGRIRLGGIGETV